MFDIGVLAWENGNPVIASKFLNPAANFAQNESSIEEQCMGLFAEKDLVRVVQKLCSAKSYEAICKKKGIYHKSQLYKYARIEPKEISCAY